MLVPAPAIQPHMPIAPLLKVCDDLPTELQVMTGEYQPTRPTQLAHRLHPRAIRRQVRLEQLAHAVEGEAAAGFEGGLRGLPVDRWVPKHRQHAVAETFR